MDKIESSRYYDYDQFDSESSEESPIEESNKVKSFNGYNECVKRRIGTTESDFGSNT